VILFVDHQTSGGYPVIAGVISADLAHLGQLRPGSAARFTLVPLEAARALLLEQEAWLSAPEIVAP
jgi:antagonist of KipI